MNVLHGLKAGDSVKVTYRPMPYLGTGIQEPVVVEGILAEPKVNRGITYVIVKDNKGNCKLERNMMEIESIVKAGGATAPETFSVPRSYNKVQ